ncbi:MAG: polysaccharide deacetylase family protein [Methylocystaceae bacterium]
MSDLKDSWLKRGLSVPEKQPPVIIAILLLLVLLTAAAYILLTPPDQPVVNIISEVAITDRCVAITFDDGPDPVYTPMMLDLLEENQVKATFFLIGLHSEWYPELVKRINKEGHEIGNHSYYHKNYSIKSPGYVAGDMQRTNELLTKITGVRPCLLRPPFGRYNDKTVEIAKEQQLQVVCWSINSLDWQRPAAYVMERQVRRHLGPGQIILFHDGGGRRKETVRAVANFIKTAQDEGYRFLTVSEMIKYQNSSSSNH